MKKHLFFKGIIVFIGMLLVLVACSSSDSGGSKEGKIQLTMSAWGNPQEIEVYQRALTAYEEKYPHVSIKLTPVPGSNYEQKILAELSGGQAPDVFYVGSESISKFIETGKLKELSKFLESEDSFVKVEDFADGLWGAARRGNEIYGVSVDNNPFLMYYNKNVLKEAGIEKSPQELFEEGKWNWDTFEEITGQLVEAGKRGFIAENSSGHLFSWVWTNGGRLYDDEGNFILEENEKAQEAFHYLARLVKNGNITYGGSLPQGQGADAMFMSNQVGFIAAGRWLTPMFSQNKSLDFDYIPWPTNTGNKMEKTAIAIAFMSVSADSKHLEEAMKFMSFYVSPEGQKTRLADNGNAVPSVSGVDEIITEDAVPEHAKYLIDAREIGQVESNQVQIPGLDKEIADIMDLMYLGQKDAEETIKEVSAKAKEMIAEYRNEK